LGYFVLIGQHLETFSLQSNDDTHSLRTVIEKTNSNLTATNFDP